jgi:hypothetical protein
MSLSPFTLALEDERIVLQKSGLTRKTAKKSVWESKNGGLLQNPRNFYGDGAGRAARKCAAAEG